MYYNYILPLHATSVHNQTLHGALSMARSMLAPPTWLVSSHFCGHPLPCSKESNADSKRASSSLVRLDGPFVRPPLLRIFWPMWRSNSNLSMLSFVKIRPFWFMALALGSTVLAFGGLETVLIIDIATFSVAFIVLLFFINIPDITVKSKDNTDEISDSVEAITDRAAVISDSAEAAKETFLKSCMAGINFLREHSALLRIILFFAFINFIAKMGSYGMLPTLILSRTGNDQIALGMVEAAVGIGTLAGSIFVTLMRPARNRVWIIFFACGISFLLGDVGQSLTHSLPLWIAAAFTSNVPMAFLGANLTAIMRTNVPIEMQGRVFAARDTIQFSTIPLGLFIGGVLADYVFEPFMTSTSPLQNALSFLFGTGKGSGIAIIFFIVGVIGFVTSFIALRNPLYQSLNREV
jgi:DHA3 family macrolide efflux protein-like MFS transporter